MSFLIVILFSCLTCAVVACTRPINAYVHIRLLSVYVIIEFNNFVHNITKKCEIKNNFFLHLSTEK